MSYSHNPLSKISAESDEKKAESRVPAAIQHYCLSPSESQLYYKYPICILDDDKNTPIEENKLYLSSDDSMWSSDIDVMTATDSLDEAKAHTANARSKRTPIIVYIKNSNQYWIYSDKKGDGTWKYHEIDAYEGTNLGSLFKDTSTGLTSISKTSSLLNPCIETLKKYHPLKKIKYTVRNSSGEPISFTTEIPSPYPFAPEKLSDFQERILQIALEKNHIQQDKNNNGYLYAGIRCVSYTKKTFWTTLLSWLSPINWLNWKRTFHVPENHIAFISNNGKIESVGPGDHVILSPFVTPIETVSLQNADGTYKRHISCQTRHIFRLSDNQMQYVADHTGKFKLHTTGVHDINQSALDIREVLNPYGDVVSIPKTSQEQQADHDGVVARNAIRGGKKLKADGQEKKQEAKGNKKEPKSQEYRTLFMTVPEGNLGVIYDQEERRILSPGCYFMPPQWFFNSLFSTKITTLNLDIVEKGIDGIEIKATAQVTYQIESDHAYKVVDTLGPNNIKEAIVNASGGEAKNQIRATNWDDLNPPMSLNYLTSVNNHNELKNTHIKILKVEIIKKEPTSPAVREAANQQQAELFRAQQFRRQQQHVSLANNPQAFTAFSGGFTSASAPSAPFAQIDHLPTQSPF